MSQPPLLPPEESIAAETKAQAGAPRRPLSPYPGLRPFRPDESRLFCGRSQNRIELLSRLEESRFIAVIGASGSGKSSLVMAGLLPDIAEGLLLTIEPGTSREVYFKPGRNPFRALAEGLARAFEAQGEEAEIERLLRHSSAQGFRKVLDRFLGTGDPAAAPPAMIVVADQFEEIFRFASLEKSEVDGAEFLAKRGGVPVLDTVQNEAQAFVDLLLNAYTLPEYHVHVVLTMRSDFLHRCEAFDRLPGVISTHQYLTPRPQRDQLADSIAIPATHFGATMQPELVNLILNDLSPEQDQLPILEHALARVWQHAVRTRQPPFVLTVEDYRAIGGIQRALSLHGREILDRVAQVSDGTLGDGEAGRFFRCLAEWDPAGALIRRPRTVAQVAAESGLTLAQVRQIADEFRGPNCHWLTPMMAETEELDPERVLDLTHESLLRKWDRYSDKDGWMGEEKERRDAFRRLWERMNEPIETTPLQRRIFSAMKLDLRALNPAYLSGTQLQRFREILLKEPEPTEAWANRYGGNWAEAKKFLLSAIAKQRAAVLSVLIVFAGIAGALIWGAVMQERAEKERVQREKTEKLRASEAELHETQQAAANRALALARDESERLTGEIDSSKRTISELQEMIAAQQAKERQARELAEANPAFAALNETVQSTLNAALESPEPPRTSAALGEKATLAGAVSYPAHTKPIQGLAFVSPGGTDHLVTGAGDGKVVLRSLDGTWARTLLEESATSIIADGVDWVMVANGDTRLRFVHADPGFDTETLTLPRAEPDEAIVSAAVIDENRALFWTSTGRLGIYSAEPDAVAFFKDNPHKKAINSVSYSAKTNYLLAGGEDRFVTLWKIPPGGPAALLKSFPMKAAVLATEINAEGTAALVLDARGVVQVIAAPSGTSVELPHNRPVLAASWNPKKMIVATAEELGRVNLWTISDARPKSVDLSAHKRSVTQMRWSPDGSFLVTADEGGLVLVWQDAVARAEAATGRLPLIFPSHRGAVTALALSDDGAFIASGASDGTVSVLPLKPVIAGPALVDFGPDAAEAAKGAAGLALLDESDADEPDYQYLFSPRVVPQKGENQAPGAASLTARLNPKQYYLAARWDYALTSRAFLRNSKVRVKNPKTGEFIMAQPVDFGPPPQTGAVARLSPGLAKALKLGVGERVEISIDLLASPGDGVIQGWRQESRHYQEKRR